MNENYLVLNGKRIDLTKEQLETLGIIEKDYNPFDRVAVGCCYCFIDMFGDVNNYTQRDDNEDDALFNSYNYFNDDSVAQQVALHQLLYRKLLISIKIIFAFVFIACKITTNAPFRIFPVIFCCRIIFYVKN